MKGKYSVILQLKQSHTCTNHDRIIVGLEAVSVGWPLSTGGETVHKQLSTWTSLQQLTTGDNTPLQKLTTGDHTPPCPPQLACCPAQHSACVVWSPGSCPGDPAGSWQLGWSSSWPWKFQHIHDLHRWLQIQALLSTRTGTYLTMCLKHWHMHWYN